MVPVTTTQEQSQPDLKLVIHRTIHRLVEREKEHSGWYGDVLSTSWIGVALQAHDGHADEISSIAEELENWYGDADISQEYEVAALGLMAEFFKEYDRGQSVYSEIENQFFATLDEEKDRREESSSTNNAPRFQFFNSYPYLYCALVGAKAYDRLDEYRDFLEEEVEAQRQDRWVDYNRMAFVETVALEVSSYDPEECRRVLKEMRRVDVEELNDYELIPLVWFFQQQQDAIQEALPDEKFAQEFVDEIRQNLWGRLWEELPFELYLTDDIEYNFTPDIQQLALLDQLLGRLDNKIIVFSEEQLEKYEEDVAAEKDFDIQVNRRRKLWGYIGMSFLGGFIAIDYVIGNPPPSDAVSTVQIVQTIVVFLLMHLEWRLEDLSKDYSFTRESTLISDIVDTVENRNWPAWILRLLFGLVGWLVVGYYWAEIQAFFLNF